MEMHNIGHFHFIPDCLTQSMFKVLYELCSHLKRMKVWTAKYTQFIILFVHVIIFFPIAISLLHSYAYTVLQSSFSLMFHHDGLPVELNT